jgi:hypothetical protein
MSAPINPRPGPADVLDRDTLEDIDELEDTQPSVLWWPDRDDDFWDAPTIPGFRMRADGSVVYDDSAKSAGDDDEKWDRVLRAVAVAVRRVFASHSIS